MIDLRDARIGYAPYSETLDRPGDRRRFCYYASKRNLKFEISRPSQTYDLVVVTAGADISLWSEYQRGKAKIVYDQIDSYLAIPKLDPKRLFRGLAKYATGQNRRLLVNYSTGIQRMCSRADAVICSTAEQRQDILPYCRNVHVILDFHGSVVRTCKSDYSAGEVFNFVWEGLPGNLRFLSEIKEVLRELQKKRRIALHAITDLRYGKYLNGRFSQRRTEDEARKIFDPIYLYSWNEQTCSAIICACDLALIPIPLQDPLFVGKPENKLHLFWRMGMPTVVSATPAYARAMQECGLSMACKTLENWRETLQRYISSEDARREAGQRGKAFVEQRHSEKAMLSQWDEVFFSILGKSETSQCPPDHVSEAPLSIGRSAGD